jgi:hypothetical protein
LVRAVQYSGMKRQLYCRGRNFGGSLRSGC